MMLKMNICIISTSYPNEDGIGNTFVEQLVNAMTYAGHHCIVISPLNTYGNHYADRYKEYEIKRLDGDKKVEVYRPRIWNRNIPFLPVSTNGFLAQRAIEKTIVNNHLKFDIIYCHFFASAMYVWHYAHKYNIPLYVATGESKIKIFTQKPCLSFSWEKFRHDTNGVICVSTKNLEECISLGYADRRKCKVFPNGTNSILFKPLDKLSCREKLGYSKDDFITITVGEFSERKGQERIIKAIDQIASSRIKSIFIGDGDSISERDYILYKGKVRHDDLPTYLSVADVFVLPTLREGCCNAIVEAMACGLPIISSDLSFNHDILNRNNSIMIDPESPSAIAEAIKKLMNEPDYAQTLGSEALKTSLSLSIYDRAKNIIDFIQQTR